MLGRGQECGHAGFARPFPSACHLHVITWTKRGFSNSFRLHLSCFSFASCYMGVLAAALTVSVERCYTFLLLQGLVVSSIVKQAELICRCGACLWQFQVANSIALRSGLGIACEGLSRRDWEVSVSTFDGENSPSVCVSTIQEPGDHRTRENVLSFYHRRGVLTSSSVDLGHENSRL